MAIMRASEIREKDDAELETNIIELKKTLMKIRGGLASGGIPEDVGKAREIKKTIARILTIRHERKLGLKRERKVVVKKEAVQEKSESQEDKPKAKTVKTKKAKEVSTKK